MDASKQKKARIGFILSVCEYLNGRIRQTSFSAATLNSRSVPIHGDRDEDREYGCVVCVKKKWCAVCCQLLSERSEVGWRMHGEKRKENARITERVE